MSENLLDRVMALPRETVIEAARFVTADAAATASEADIERAGRWAEERPFAHVVDVEALARIVLCVRAASGPEGTAQVEKAVAGSGRQNLVLGGTEIVLLAALGVIALQVWKTGGKLVEEETTYGHDANGKPVVIVKRIEKPLGISDALAAVIKPLLGAG